MPLLQHQIAKEHCSAPPPGKAREPNGPLSGGSLSATRKTALAQPPTAASARWPQVANLQIYRHGRFVSKGSGPCKPSFSLVLGREETARQPELYGTRLQEQVVGRRTSKFRRRLPQVADSSRFSTPLASCQWIEGLHTNGSTWIGPPSSCPHPALSQRERKMGTYPVERSFQTSFPRHGAGGVVYLKQSN